MPRGRRARVRVPRGRDDAGADDPFRAAPESLRWLLELRRASADDGRDGGPSLGASDPRRDEDQAARGVQRVGAGMKGSKFLTADGEGLFSRFAWPLPNGRPGRWVESEIEPCRSGIHACRKDDLPYWIAPALYEIEVDAPIEAHAIKVVAGRGRLLRRIDAWDAATRHAYGQMCFARAHELVAASEDRFDDWAPTPERVAGRAPRARLICARLLSAKAALSSR